MRIAVASSDGKMVNQHFGKATQFLIFDVDSEKIELKETRSNMPPCGSDEYQGHSDDALGRAISLIADCEAVLCSRIGMGAAAELMSRNILPFEVGDFIEEAIKDYLDYRVKAGIDQRRDDDH